jgi:hypothetical protein
MKTAISLAGFAVERFAEKAEGEGEGADQGEEAGALGEGTDVGHNGKDPTRLACNAKHVGDQDHPTGDCDHNERYFRIVWSGSFFSIKSSRGVSHFSLL